MAAPSSTSLLSALRQLPLAPFSGKSSPPSLAQVAPRRAPTAVLAAKGYNVQIVVDENEGEDSIFRRFRREVMRARLLQEIKRRRRYESKKDEKIREAGRRNRRRFAGKIIGCYYDSQGNPTKYLKGVEVKAKRDAQLLEKQKSEEAKIPNCNSKWSQQEGGEVWCETGYPRLVRRPGDIALTGKVSQRCACFQEDELGKPGLLVYEGCDYLSKSCKVK